MEWEGRTPSGRTAGSGGPVGSCEGPAGRTGCLRPSETSKFLEVNMSLGPQMDGYRYQPPVAATASFNAPQSIRYVGHVTNIFVTRCWENYVIIYNFPNSTVVALSHAS